jgi:hypothetical protein
MQYDDYESKQNTLQALNSWIYHNPDESEITDGPVLLYKQTEKIKKINVHTDSNGDVIYTEDNQNNINISYDIVYDINTKYKTIRSSKQIEDCNLLEDILLIEEE